MCFWLFFFGGGGGGLFCSQEEDVPASSHCLLWHERERIIWMEARRGAAFCLLCMLRDVNWYCTDNLGEGGACVGREEPALWASVKTTLLRNDLFSCTQWQDVTLGIFSWQWLWWQSEHHFPCLHWGSYLYYSTLESKSFSPPSPPIFFKLCRLWLLQ